MRGHRAGSLLPGPACSAVPEAGPVVLQPPLCLSFLGSAIKPVAEGPDPEGEWETVQLRGSWRIGQTAGGSRNFASYPTNPCLPLSVPGSAGPRCVRITLRQHCSHSDCHPIGFHVFQASSSCSWEGPSEELCRADSGL